MSRLYMISLFFFFNDTATTEIYTLSLHDALPIWAAPGRWLHQVYRRRGRVSGQRGREVGDLGLAGPPDAMDDGGECLIGDRKSTRLNSSHSQISYAVFCLKKKKKRTHAEQT